MDILVIGGGGRERAVVKKLKENPGVGTISLRCPETASMTADAVCVPEIGAQAIFPRRWSLPRRIRSALPW